MHIKKLKYYLLLVILFLSSTLYSQRKLNNRWFKKDHIEYGWLKFDLDSIYVIDFTEGDFLQKMNRNSNMFDNKSLISSAKFDSINIKFSNTNNKDVTRIFISYYNDILPDLFTKELPFTQEDFPNLKEVLFYFGFPKPTSLIYFNSIRSIYYHGKFISGGRFAIGESYFRIPFELTQMNNLQRLRLESAAVEFPDYIRDFKKLQMILQKHNYLDCSELNILSIESLQFYFRDNLSNRNNLEYMFFYKYVLRSVAETHWDDGFDTYYFFYSDTEEPPIRQKDIVNYNKAFGDTTFYSFYRNKNEGKNVDPELLLEGMTFKGTPIGIWNIRDKKYDFTDGFSITKLDYGKSIIQKDEFTFFSYIKENATLKKNDEFVASLTLYHEKCFYSGNKAYKDILSSFLKTGETNFVNTEYVFSVNKESSFLLYENGLFLAGYTNDEFIGNEKYKETLKQFIKEFNNGNINNKECFYFKY